MWTLYLYLVKNEQMGFLHISVCFREYSNWQPPLGFVPPLMLTAVPLYSLQTQYFQCRAVDKDALLLHLLTHVIKKEELTVIFLATKHHVEYVNMVSLPAIPYLPPSLPPLSLSHSPSLPPSLPPSPSLCLSLSLSCCTLVMS